MKRTKVQICLWYMFVNYFNAFKLRSTILGSHINFFFKIVHTVFRPKQKERNVILCFERH